MAHTADTSPSHAAVDRAPNEAARAGAKRSVRAAAAPHPPRQWKAELELWFSLLAGKTRLARRRHLGPLMVQSPFHPEKDGTCHVYLLHPPGGVAGGDALAVDVHAGSSSRVLLTTPGATKFYRAEESESRQVMKFDIAPGSVCEYFPQETILFDGARADTVTQVTLTGDASYSGWEFFCLGRPAAHERFDSGWLQQRIEITRDGRPIWFERSSLRGGSRLLKAAHALAGHAVWGTFVHAGPFHDGAAEKVRRAVGPGYPRYFSVSQLEDVIVCRYLGPQAAEGKAVFARAWDALRLASHGKAAVTPRIWAT